MDTNFKENLNQLRSSFLNIKRNKLEEPDKDGEIKNIYLLLIEYEDYLLESTLYVLQGGLDFEGFTKKEKFQNLLESISDDQKINLSPMLNRITELEGLEKLIKSVINDNLISMTFTSVSPDTKFSGIYNANGHLEAESLRLFLNSLGFPVRIYQESAGVVYGLTVGPLGLAEVMVPEEDEEQAKEILLAMDEGLFIQDDDEVLPEMDDLEDI